MTPEVKHRSRWNGSRQFASGLWDARRPNIAAQAHRAGKALECLNSSMTIDQRWRDVANQKIRA